MRKSQKRLIKFFVVVAILYIIFFQFNPVIQRPIFNILIAIYGLVRDYGVSIIILTLIIRLALYPLVKKQFIQQKKIQSLQPELAKIKKKANGNKMLESTMMQELYKEKNISMGGSMLTLIIQLPIFMAIFWIIRDISTNPASIGNYTYGFLKGLPVISSIVADPSTFHPHLFGFIDLTHVAVQDWVVMLLAVLAAIFQYLQMRQTQPKGKDKKTLRGLFKDAASGKEMSQTEIMSQSMGSMTKLMPVMTFIIAINFPGAIVLYYAATSGFAILQQKFILHRLSDDLETVADESKIDVKKIKEAEIISEAPKKNKHGITVRRIVVEPKKGGK
jgi:YidC/Oxa1 family membrane protein insertase